MDNTEKRAFIQTQIDGLEKPIFEQTILQKGYAAGGDVTKEQLEKTTATLGSLIAVREAFVAELAEYPAA
jgi:hypothetical protein